MASFKGTMTIVGQRGSAVPVDAQIGERVLVLKVEGVDVGSWALDDVSAEPSGAGVTLHMGGDTVEIDVTDRLAFLGALRRPPAPEKGRRRRRLKLPSLALSLTVLMLVGVVAATILYPEVVGAVLLMLGLVALVSGAAAYAEPRVALRLPLALQATHLLLAGMALAVVGVVVTLLG